mgnify:FL=1
MKNFQIIKLLLSFAKPYRKFAIANIIVVAATILIGNFLAPVFLSQILNQFQAGTISWQTTSGLVIAYAVTQVLAGVIGWRLVLWIVWRIELKVQADMHQAIFKKLINQSIDFHSSKFSGSLVSQTHKFVGSFERLWDELTWSLVPVIVSITTTVIVLSFYLWQYSLILVAITIIFIFVVIHSSKFMTELNENEAKSSTKLTGLIADSIGNIAIVKSNGQEPHEVKHVTNQVNTWCTNSLKVMRGVLISDTAYSSLNNVLIITALVAAVIASEHGWMSVGIAYLVLNYTGQVTQLWGITNIVRKYYRIIGEASEMAEILTTETKLVDQTTKKLQVKKGTVEFKNISYTYEGGAGVNIFNQFNLKIPAGQRVGIVGRSGSGKTSLTRILLRFSDVSDGAVLIDNQDITKVSQESLHKSIAYVPQESSLFHRSIRDNIAYGKPEASEVEIIASAKEANAWEFISKLPEGLDTMVGERGVKLSGGQRQRIAIARAILKNSPILVLDEATSALDSESEKLIQDSLDNLMKNRTSLVIAHRLSTIAKLDRIIVLDQGQIVEDGTHDQLIKQKGIYAKLWRHQSGGFIDSEE